MIDIRFQGAVGARQFVRRAVGQANLTGKRTRQIHLRLIASEQRVTTNADPFRDGVRSGENRVRMFGVEGALGIHLVTFASPIDLQGGHGEQGEIAVGVDAMNGQLTENHRFDVSRVEMQLKAILVIDRARIVLTLLDSFILGVKLNFIRVEILTRITSILKDMMIIVKQANGGHVMQCPVTRPFRCFARISEDRVTRIQISGMPTDDQQQQNEAHLSCHFKK